MTRPDDDEIRRQAAEMADTLSGFALPFIYGLVKLRKAADAGEGCSLEPVETKAVVDAFRLLKDGPPQVQK